MPLDISTPKRKAMYSLKICKRPGSSSRRFIIDILAQYALFGN
jgi:hypothetical protein